LFAWFVLLNYGQSLVYFNFNSKLCKEVTLKDEDWGEGHFFWIRIQRLWSVCWHTGSGRAGILIILLVSRGTMLSLRTESKENKSSDTFCMDKVGQTNLELRVFLWKKKRTVTKTSETFRILRFILSLSRYLQAWTVQFEEDVSLTVQFKKTFS